MKNLIGTIFAFINGNRNKLKTTKILKVIDEFFGL